MLGDSNPDYNLQQMMWNYAASVEEILEAQGEDLDLVLLIVNEVH